MREQLKNIQQAETFALLAMFFLILVGSMQAGKSVAPPADSRPPVIDDTEAERRRLAAQSKMIEEQLEAIKDRESLAEDKERKIEKKEASVNQQEKAVTQREEDVEATKIDYPPIITISSKEISFELGEAFPEAGEDALKNYVESRVVPEIKAQISAYENVNVVEVIGHTDASEVSTGQENLDTELLSNLANMKGKTYEQMVKSFRELDAASNVDLGLLRALVIVEALKVIESEQKDIFAGRIEGFMAYSAGQLYLPEAISTADPNATAVDGYRRRIEIRLTQRDTGKLPK